ncbi:MAG TPA: adenylate/guanylate cyclase domain-containing protein [Candidatus Acidoferrum sp.]|nr:adenylate/guanylate cyclase domain-containing protein [Candidatus Acidoferrum sp.]
MTDLVQRTWHWHFEQSVNVVWPVLADTARFNEAAGFPPHQIREDPQPDGSVRYFGSARLGSYQLEWEEIPVNWSKHLWFTHERRFSKGPFSEVTAHVAFEPKAGGGCTCHYTLGVRPANWLGYFVLWTGFFAKTEKKFRSMADAARAYVTEQSNLQFDFMPPVLPDGARRRCLQLHDAMQSSPYHHDLLPLLINWMLERPETDLWTLRPKHLARLWQVDELDTIEAFLLAAKGGLLNLSWELLCPNCRVGKQTSASMDEIPQGAHCSSCNIDYGRNFNRNVELMFQPSKSIRPLQSGIFCLFGPMTTPHVTVQLRVSPGSTRTETVDLPPGTYRLRTLEPGNDQFLDHQGGPLLPVIFTSDHQLQLSAPAGTALDQLTIHNHSNRNRILVVETRAWVSDVLTASEAIALQCFRDLFDEHILRPGDHVEIDNITLLFTDIKASTLLYERSGDAAAFALVREHFAVLAACVRRHHGTIVKTLGDAIMAAFHLSSDAVECAITIQRDFAEFNRTRANADETVLVKLGLHGGPCITVTLNGILDYYGKVANQTARIQTLCEGGDIVLSQTLAEEPAVAAVLRQWPLERGTSQLKGISGETAWVRITSSAFAKATA